MSNYQNISSLTGTTLAASVICCCWHPCLEDPAGSGGRQIPSRCKDLAGTGQPSRIKIPSLRRSNPKYMLSNGGWNARDRIFSLLEDLCGLIYGVGGAMLNPKSIFVTWTAAAFSRFCLNIPCLGRDIHHNALVRLGLPPLPCPSRSPSGPVFTAHGTGANFFESCIWIYLVLCMFWRWFWYRSLGPEGAQCG